MEDSRLQELADKMGPDYFNRKLQDEVRIFEQNLSAAKKTLKKSDLVNLLKYVVTYPEGDKSKLSPKILGLAENATNAKDSFVALTVQFLIEEGKKLSNQNSQPKFKGE